MAKRKRFDVNLSLAELYAIRNALRETFEDAQKDLDELAAKKKWSIYGGVE